MFHAELASGVANGACLLMTDGKRAWKHEFCKSMKVCVFWFPRYIPYSMEAKWIESIGTGGKRSINSSCRMIVNKFFSISKNQKKKKRKLKLVEGEGDENKEDEMVKLFGNWFWKQIKKRKENSQLLTSNYSINHASILSDSCLTWILGHH